MAASEVFYGEKYEQLNGIRAEVAAAGMFVPGMVGIDQSMIDAELAAASLPTIAEAEAAALLDGFSPSDDMTDHLVESALNLQKEFDGGPLILRSSARADATGNGVYHSERFDPTPESARRAFGLVVASYFTEKAQIFRERVGVESGFATFIQPMVGTVLEGSFQYADTTRNPPGPKPLFHTPYSGNARVATPLYPAGAMTIQDGIGSAVEISGVPVLDFADSEWDGESPKHAMSDAMIGRSSHRDWRRYERESFVLEHGLWTENYGEYAPAQRPNPQIITLGALKAHLQDLNNRLGGHPAYYEFVVRDTATEQQIYVIQKGDLANGRVQDQLQQVDSKLVMIGEMTVEGGNGASPKMDTILCLTDENKTDLYAFDKTPEADRGYMVVFSAARTPRRNPIDMARLKNVRAFVTLENNDYSHVGRPQDHILGYSDQTGTPLISICGSRANRAWQTLNGSDRSHDQELERFGTMIIRRGNFQVMTEASSRDGLILDLDTA